MSELRESRDAEHGYRTVGGKALRLQQWAERKEDKAFAKLVNRLNVRRWVGAVYQEGGPRLQALRKVKAQHAARKAVAKREGRRGRVTTCLECKVQWCRLPGVVGRREIYCCLKCQRAGEWKRVKERRRTPCRGCGGVKPAGQGRTYCGACRPRETGA